MAGTIYALANQKGGVGKTTTAVNLAACLAEAGERVLVVDLDPQANASSGLGLAPFNLSTADLLDGASLDAAVQHTRFANLDAVPASPDLAGSAADLGRRDASERYLADALAPARERYGFIFVDCPPSLGPLTVNALAAADRVLVPVQAEYYAMEGLAQLLQTISVLRARLNPGLAVAGVVLTMVDGRTRLSADVATELDRHLGDLLFRARVPRSVRLAEAPSHGLPVIHYDRRSTGAAAYWDVANELIERVARHRAGAGADADATAFALAGERS
ncbi:MAG TPA: ParA family protein [Gaiellaceae bacterium]|nr:ParA family protein [Gaiellaceae bacterium]